MKQIFVLSIDYLTCRFIELQSHSGNDRTTCHNFNQTQFCCVVTNVIHIYVEDHNLGSVAKNILGVRKVDDLTIGSVDNV